MEGLMCDCRVLSNNMQTRIYIFSWIFLTLAVCSWVGVGFFAWNIMSLNAQRALNIAAQKNSTNETGVATWVYTTTANTQQERGQLESYVNMDPVALIKTLTTTAKAIKFDIAVTSAGSEGGTGQIQPSGTHSFGFITQSQGTFSSLMRGVQLLETLPAPSAIQQLELIRSVPLTNSTSTRGGDSWNMNVHVQVLTNAQLSL